MSHSNYGDWSPDSGAWDIGTLAMQDLNDFTAGGGEYGSGRPARSVLSFSEESLSSGDDLSADYVGVGSQGLMGMGSRDSYLLEGLDGAFGL